jgi:hypothetical protein
MGKIIDVFLYELPIDKTGWMWYNGDFGAARSSARRRKKRGGLLPLHVRPNLVPSVPKNFPIKVHCFDLPSFILITL